MKLVDRVILTLYSISLAFISAAITLVALGWEAPLQFLGTSLHNPNGRWVVGILGPAFFAASVRFLYYGFGRDLSGQALVHETNLGEVRVSLDAVENLVKRVGRQVKGVREVRAFVRNSQGGIKVKLRATVSPDVSIPEISDEIQRNLKSYVRNIVGAEVAEVRILVDNITSEARRGRVG